MPSIDHVWSRISCGAVVLAAALAYATSLSALAQAPAPAPTPTTTVTLLGTAGGPGGHPERAGIATLITVGQRQYLVDAGEGVSRQLSRAGLKESAVDTVFLTHLHDDHTAGLPALLTFAWTLRSSKMELIGPPGTRSYFDAAMALIDVNVAIRSREARGQVKPPSAVFSAREVAPGLIYSDDTVRVFAMENTHYGLTADAGKAEHRSYSLKFQTPDRTIVLTGDTGVAESLVEFAKGADVLVSEIASSVDVAAVPPFVREHMVKEHLTATQVGQLAARANVRTVVLSHMREVSARDVDEIKRNFSGNVVAGTDLARF